MNYRPEKTKKDIKNEYKQKVFKKGVFQIRNIANGKIFVSSGMNLDVNWNSHKFRLNLGMHESKDLQKDWNEFGEDNFVYEILEVLKEPEDINIDCSKDIKQLEEMCLEELQPYGEKGYNKIKK